MSASLNAVRRLTDLAEAAEERADVVVIGGGITGAGIALDAASRGLRVTLIEAHDLAFGTSRWSSKLVHGGLRYLATGDVATARESAVERHRLMTTIAPHLIRPLQQVVPFASGVTMVQRGASALGMALGDALRMNAHTPTHTLPRPRFVRRQRATALVPALAHARLGGAMVGTDGQLVDDARLVVAVARTAAACGARILTRVRAVSIDSTGVDAVDTLSGESLRLEARAVITAAGVWSESLDPAVPVQPSRGTHLVVDAARMGKPRAALMVPHPGSISRYVFALPQDLGRVIIGLTDEPAPGPVDDEPQASEGEITFLLETVNTVLAAPLERGDVMGTFAGLRPLVGQDDADTADVSRRHLVRLTDSGSVTVLGGKLTTYRRMAEDAVDLAVATRKLAAGPCRTASLPLVGAGVSAYQSARGWRYGTEAARVLNDARRADGLSCITPKLDVLRAEVEFAVRHEGALSAADVLDRRTRIGLVPADRVACEPVVSEIVAETLANLG